MQSSSFEVGSNTILSVYDIDSGKRGFVVNTTQISAGQGVGSVHDGTWLGAEKQILGGYIDSDTGEAYLNEADIDAFEGWSFYPEISETINWNQDAPGAAGNFNANNDHEDARIPGIPGWGDANDGIAAEILTILYLAEGTHTLGVNSDDGFRATLCANYRDVLPQVIEIGRAHV